MDKHFRSTINNIKINLNELRADPYDSMIDPREIDTSVQHQSQGDA